MLGHAVVGFRADDGVRTRDPQLGNCIPSLTACYLLHEQPANRLLAARAQDQDLPLRYPSLWPKRGGARAGRALPRARGGQPAGPSDALAKSLRERVGSSAASVRSAPSGPVRTVQKDSKARRDWSERSVSKAHKEHEAKATVTNAKPSCKGTTKAGKPCASTVLVDGEHCLVHSSRGFDPVEAGRKGGRSRLSRGVLSRKTSSSRSVRDARGCASSSRPTPTSTRR